MDNIKYVPLHVHDEYSSVGDSILKLDKYIDKIKKFGINSAAITNHGDMSSMIKFYDLCVKNEVNPIIGCEVYWTNDRLVKEKETEKSYHLILLAKNANGVKNLLKITNEAVMSGFYYKPRIDDTLLAKYSEDIICLSSCVGGYIPQSIIKEEYNLAEDKIKLYKQIFKDNFYLEIQPGSFVEQITVNKKLVEYAKQFNVKLVMTNDVHYLDKNDYIVHDAHVKIYRKKTLEEHSSLEYPDTCYYIMSGNEVFELFKSSNPDIDENIILEAINNTVVISSQCETILDLSPILPKFNGLPENTTDEQEFLRLCFKKLNSIIHTLNNPNRYVDRLLYEFNVIKQLGFCSYFLMVHDFLEYATKHNIAIGPGRGSAGASIVAWLLGICVADPVKNNLMFERFLSADRVGLPDIDIDIDSNKRNELLKYVGEKYGYDHCLHVSNKTFRKARPAIRDAGRLLSIDLQIVDLIAKLIPKVYYADDSDEKETDLSIEESLKVVPELVEYQKKYPKLFDYAIKLEGLPCSSGVHAAGVLISPVSIMDLIPIKKVSESKYAFHATSLDKVDAERLLVKFDFLGNATLGVIEKAKRNAKIDIDLNKDTFFEDDKVWDLIGSRSTTGLFQIGSKTYKDRMCRLKPRNLKELAACLALVRSPCISAKTDEVYMRICEGKEKIRSIQRDYDELTKDTKGIIIYQEQIMRIAVAMGLSITDSYKLLKGISKKKLDVVASFKEKFYKCAEQKNVNIAIVDNIWSKIEDAGLYAFNEPHGIDYGIVTYESAWLKTHYPKEYLASLLTNAYIRNKTEEINGALDDCKRLGIKFLPLDINKSEYDFVVEEDKIRIGFVAIKGLGDKAVTSIIENRTKKYTSLTRFINMVDTRLVNKKAMVVLIYSGCFDEVYESETRLDIYKRYYKIKEGKDFDDNDDNVDSNFSIGKEKVSVYASLEDLESCILGAQYLSDPSANLQSINFSEVKNNKIITTDVMIVKSKKHKDKNGNMMMFMTLLFNDGQYECVVFADTYKEINKAALKNNSIHNVTIQKSNKTCKLLKINNKE